MNRRPPESALNRVAGDVESGLHPVRELWRLIQRSALGGTAALSGFATLLAVGFAVGQWLNPPICIMPFMIDPGTKVAGISAAALADQTKANISDIYAQSGGLFQTRKLGDSPEPLAVKIGSTGLTPQQIARLFNLSLSAAEVQGRIAPDGDRLLLQWTTVQPAGITVDEYAIDASGTSPLADIDQALACLALRTVARISPDVAANYLHKQDEASEASAAGAAVHSCIAQDDAVLYSSVSKDDAVPAPARVNALVGLSVHFAYLHQYSEELSMALAAGHLSSRLLTCDDALALPTRWSRISCRIGALRPFSDKPHRAAIAAGMQLGAAYSDFAAAAPTLGEMQQLRLRAIEAYDHVIQIDGRYAPAYDARGLQQSLSGHPTDARDSYQQSLEARDMAPARIDRALLEMHGRSESFEDRPVEAADLAAAEADLRRAIELSPDYWDAHAGLGYVLYLQGREREAVDVLETAVAHDAGNRPLRRLLGTVYAGLCRFDAARSNYRQVYDQSLARGDLALASDLAADWGSVLQRFGLTPWAFIQEQFILESAPGQAAARTRLGVAAIELSRADADVMEMGLAQLKAAVDDDASKSDAVLNAYLVELNRAGRFADTVAAYEDWGRRGFVPAAAAPTLADAAIQPVKPQARLRYAQALVEVGRRADALREFQVLEGVGIPPPMSQTGVAADRETPCVAPPPESSILFTGTSS